MKQLFNLLLILCLTPFGLSAQSLSQAEALFAKEDFTAAKAQYAQVIEKSSGPEKFQAQLRLAACEYQLGEYLTAAKNLFNAPLPQDPLWKARFLLYRIQLAQRNRSVYRRILNEHEIDTPEARADLETWTQTQWDQQIDQDFRQLWTLRESLLSAPIEAENLILRLKDTDTRRIPTLFDFVIQTWKSYLDENSTLKVAPLFTEKAPEFLNKTVRIKQGKQTTSSTLQAQLLEAAATLSGKNRDNARIFWKTDFILLPFDKPGHFILETKEKAIEQAILQLDALSEFDAPKTTEWWNRLKTYFQDKQEDTSYARGYTAWKTADFLNAHEQAPKALEVCAFAQTLTPSYFTQQCQNLAERIKQVSFQVELPGMAVNREAPQIQFSGKNLRTLYVNVYPTSWEELTNIYKKHYNRSNLSHWQEIFYALHTEDFLTFLKQTPRHTLTHPVDYEEPAKKQDGTITLPSLEPGIYAVLLSSDKDFNPKTAPVQAVLLNATDLALFATAAIEGDPADFTVLRNQPAKTLTAPLFHFYGVNLKTGEPVPNLPLQLLYDTDTPEQLSTNAEGTLSLKRPFTLGHKTVLRNFSYRASALARQNGSLAYTDPLYFSFHELSPVLLTLQTDRPIYRPGQKVHIALQAFERQVRGWKTFAAQKVQITVKDPNWKTIFSTTLSANELGTAQTMFTLPEEGLLGNYNIEAKLQTNGRSFSAGNDLRVEEFKRPDYEITLNEPEKALEFDKSGKITGKAAYYFGAPLTDAKVVYTLKRKAYTPPFYWWWRRPFVPEEVILQGETKTDEKGTFSVSFTPSKENEDDEFAQFVLNAEVYDESGRTIETSRSYKVSAHPHLFKVNFAQGFYDANTKSPLANIDLTDADGKSVTGKIRIKAQRLENKLPNTTISVCNGYYCQEEKSNLEELYNDFSAQNTAFEKTLSFDKPGEQTVELPALPEGVYRMELFSTKAAKQQLIFIVVQPQSKLQLPGLTLVQHNTYYPGETMRVLLGASELAGSNRVEVYQRNQFLIHKEKLSGGAQIFEFPVTQTMRGGLALRWFGASNYRFYGGSTAVTVPFDNKKLAVSPEIPAAVKPGEKVNWKINVKDATGNAINGQISATVYDKSLDYYAQYAPSLSFEKLFKQRNQIPSLNNSSGAGSTHFIGQPTLKTKHSFSSLPIPSLNLEMMIRAYALGGGRKMMMMNSRAAMAPQAMKEEMVETANYGVQDTLGLVQVASEEDQAVTENAVDRTTLRTDFAETAYFNAALPLTNGQARLQFTLPQSLTTWNIFGYALTRVADFGAFTAQTITRKDFMLRLTLPRFYREGDKGTLQAAVTNQTDRKIITQVSLNIALNNRNVLAAWGVKNPVKTVTVLPNSTQFVTWEITAPYAPELYQITAVARSGQDSDGEQKELPLLPSKQRLLASTHLALKNGVNTLALTELEKVPAQDVEMTSLTLNPSLALSVLNSMPNLLTNPHKDLVSSLNRYVPLAVVHQFYTTYPQLKEAVKKLPKRTGLTAEWNEQNPLRLELLDNTPWLRQAQGRQVHEANIINLFDDKTVSAYLSKELKNIEKFQNVSGAFTWFAGGPDDEYLTLYALQAFSQALAYQAQFPQVSAQKAFAFVSSKIEARLQKEKEGSVSAVSYALYAAYTLSSFPQTWTQYQKAKPYIKKWVDYADQHSKWMTPLGRAYAAAVYHRLGDDVKATQHLDLILSRMKEDPLTGAYFAPEPQSWVWYNDTLTTQTITLRTLLEIRPNSPKIDAMVQWLLFNRQVNDWTDSAAASQAVFSLLDVMKAKGALSSPVKYTVNWGGSQQQLSFEPFDFTQDLQWTRSGTAATAQTYTAQINKQGTMPDFASLNAIYRASEVKASPKGVLNISRAYFLRIKQDTQTKLVPLENLDNVQVGDEIEVHLTLNTDSAFEYVQVSDPKPAGFESTELISGWSWNPVSFYREERDSRTNFFINWLPNGTLTLRYVLRPTVPGQFHAAAAQAQSMFAPEYGAHSASTTIQVEKSNMERLKIPGK